MPNHDDAGALRARNVRRARLAALVLAMATCAPLVFSAQNDRSPLAVDEIIRRFAEKEQEFKVARASYTYRQDVQMQELDSRGATLYDEKGNVIEYRAVTDILFDDKGRRIEKNVQGPSNNLWRLRPTKEDFEDIRSIQPFVLTTEDLPRYTIRQAGHERIDEIDCHVFEVAPRRIESGQRYFQGTIWVDEKALQIVKTDGKAVPDLERGGLRENLFPRFTTYRQQIDGKYWFPAYTTADDTLQFSGLNGGPLRVRYMIRYENYKQFASDVRILPNSRQSAPQPPGSR